MHVSIVVKAPLLVASSDDGAAEPFGFVVGAGAGGGAWVFALHLGAEGDRWRWRGSSGAL